MVKFPLSSKTIGQLAKRITGQNAKQDLCKEEARVDFSSGNIYTSIGRTHICIYICIILYEL